MNEQTFMEIAAMPSLGAIGNPSGERNLFDKGRVLRAGFDQSTAGGAMTAPPAHLPALAARIHRILKLRASRKTIFNDSLFADPAWDMLLDIYASHLEGRIEAVSSICVASGVPSTTAIRWIKLLEQQGWIRRSPDPSDGRRCFLALTGKAEAAMERFFSQPEIASSI